MSTNSQHTIDNLCKRDKSYVVETLKELNEFRKRCTILEGQIAAVDAEQNRLLTLDATLMKQIELTEEKMLEATAISSAAHGSIAQLTIDLQNSETENEHLKSRLLETESDIVTAKEVLRQLQVRYDKIVVDTSVMCVQGQNHIETNTEQIIPKADAQSQVLSRDSGPLIDDATDLPAGWGSIADDADEDVSLLISLLNKH